MSAKEWVIWKSGYYYRPNRAGYTAEECAAGRYTEQEAKAEARIEPHHMFALHLPWKPCNPAAAAEVAALRAEVKRLKAEAVTIQAEALERAAVVADEYAEIRSLPNNKWVATELAAAIRAMKEPA